MRTSVVRYCDSSIEANLLKNMLEQNGIECYLWNENFTTLMPHFNNMLGGGIRVVVDESDLAKAIDIVGDGKSKVTCPNCQSENFVRTTAKSKKGLLMIVLAALMWLPIGNMLNEYSCDDCGQTFKS